MANVYVIHDSVRLRYDINTMTDRNAAHTDNIIKKKKNDKHGFKLKN